MSTLTNNPNTASRNAGVNSVEQDQLALVKRIGQTEQNLRTYLDELGKKNKQGEEHDPVRIKNLEKVIGHLQSLIIFIAPGCSGSPDSYGKTASLVPLLDQLNNPSKPMPNNAWELADLLEIEMVRLGDNAYIQMLLATRKARIKDAHSWTEYFSEEELNELIEDYKNPAKAQQASIRARRFLEYLVQVRIADYRRDRAKIRLRSIYLTRMAWMLVVLGSLLGLAYVVPFQWLLSPSEIDDLRTVLFTIIAGAMGSVLSRAIKLGKQPLNAEGNLQAGETPLGLRALISVGSIFGAQSVIGAMSALIIFLVLQIGLIAPVWTSSLDWVGYTLVGFLAGFSEPFFIGILDKVSGQVGSPLT